METQYHKTNLFLSQAEIAARTGGIEVKCAAPAHLSGQVRWVYPAKVYGHWNAFREPGEFAGLEDGTAAAGLTYAEFLESFVGDAVRYEPITKPTPEQLREPWACAPAEAEEAPEPESPTAFKADSGKPRWSLLVRGMPRALAAVVRVLTFAVRPVQEGGKGYVPHSWKRVPNSRERYEDALLRHLSAIHQGEESDPESGESHWAHVATNALFLAELHADPEAREES